MIITKWRWTGFLQSDLEDNNYLREGSFPGTVTLLRSAMPQNDFDGETCQSFNNNVERQLDFKLLTFMS